MKRYSKLLLLIFLVTAGFHSSFYSDASARSEISNAYISGDSLKIAKSKGLIKFQDSLKSKGSYRFLDSTKLKGFLQSQDSIKPKGFLKSQDSSMSADSLGFIDSLISRDTTKAWVIRDNNMALGNPSGAKNDTTYFSNYLMVKMDYTLSYNRTKGTPNWVSWHLSKAWKGRAPRVDAFAADTSLPLSWPKVKPSDYSNSGFDKGHVCPSDDRDSGIAENKQTFLMTNMIPQAPVNNQQTWRYLESYCQNLALNSGMEMYIIAGPYSLGGTGSKGTATSIAKGKVKVPSKVWKIIVVLSDGSDDINRITTATRVIAVLMPNNQKVKSKPWGDYRVSVDVLEALTGYDFLSALSASLQNTLELKVDNGPTQ